jgi:hypothetical protein
MLTSVLMVGKTAVPGENHRGIIHPSDYLEYLIIGRSLKKEKSPIQIDCC